jgi:hypothetical protein
MPCCFKKAKTRLTEKLEKESEDKYYILGETKVDIKPLRVSYLPKQLISSLLLNETYEGVTRRLQNSMSGYFRVGLGRPSKTLSTLLNLKTKIPEPFENIQALLKCSFLNTWNKIGDKYSESIENSLKSIEPFDKESMTRESLSRLLSGIQEAYETNSLTKLEELEYSAISLNCDIFRIYTNSNTLGCVFYSPIVRPRSRGIVILQNEDEIDILSYVTRLPRGFEFVSNIFETPFPKPMYQQLEKLRNSACRTDIPSLNDGLNVMQTILPIVDASDFSIILDPYGRGQAFYVPSKCIIPFKPSIVPEMTQTKILGYNDISKDTLPIYEEMKQLLTHASKLSKGYAFKEDVYNGRGQKVEILVESGLRIPVQSKDVGPNEPEEIIETVQSIGETNLVFGEQSKELEETYKEISYVSEVYEFLLFQLGKDIEVDNKELRLALQEVSPKKSTVEPLLREWFNMTTRFIDIKRPSKFVTKIRNACDIDSCSGSLCGMYKGVCKVNIHSVIDEDKLFHRILFSLLENAKIRSVVLDGRSTPFFSTILYLELPHELILTDLQLH